MRGIRLTRVVFPEPGRTHDRHAAAGGDAQVQIVQHGLAVVCKIQTAEFDFAFHMPVARVIFGLANGLALIVTALISDLGLLLQNLVQADQ